MPTVQQITTRDRSSGRFHRRFVVSSEPFDPSDPLKSATRILTDERCNLDQSGQYDIMPEGTRSDRGEGVPVGTDNRLLCKYCFPVEP